jgi:hypothetical protein
MLYFYQVCVDRRKLLQNCIIRSNFIVPKLFLFTTTLTTHQWGIG